MAYNPALMARLHTALHGVGPLTEKRMFGGACLMLGDHMLCGADTPRVGPANIQAALEIPGVTRMEMAGRTMAGYVFANADTLDPAALANLLTLAQTCVAALPDKKKAKR